MKTTILIVEDEKDIVKMLEYNLKKEGFETLSVRDGEDALDVAERKRPDLIILDLMLPGLDGLEVCKTLKKEAKTASIPIIMLTAKAQEADKVVGLELGADDYMTKPFSPRELIARIKAVLRRGNEKDKLPELLRIGDLIVDLEGGGQLSDFAQFFGECRFHAAGARAKIGCHGGPFIRCLPVPAKAGIHSTLAASLRSRHRRRVPCRR